MVEDALNIAIQAITSCADWFTEILDAVEGGGFYIAMIFIVFTVGFLLSNFKVAMYVGSDVVGRTASRIGSGSGKYASGKFSGSDKNDKGRFSSSRFHYNSGDGYFWR